MPVSFGRMPFSVLWFRLKYLVLSSAFVFVLDLELSMFLGLRVMWHHCVVIMSVVFVQLLHSCFQLRVVFNIGFRIGILNCIFLFVCHVARFRCDHIDSVRTVAGCIFCIARCIIRVGLSQFGFNFQWQT